jgi:hypothetical protein
VHQHQQQCSPCKSTFQQVSTLVCTTSVYNSLQDCLQLLLLDATAAAYTSHLLERACTAWHVS